LFFDGKKGKGVRESVAKRKAGKGVSLESAVQMLKRVIEGAH
jgi:hypothetical protein